MIGTVVQTAIRGLSVATAATDGAITASKWARILSRLADQSLLLAGSGVALGLGIGVTVSGVGMYLYKRKQIMEKLDA